MEELSSHRIQSVRGGVFRLATRWRTAVFPRVRALSFWLAVALPWVLFVLAVVGHVASQPALFGSLLAMTVLCGIIGHNYQR